MQVGDLAGELSLPNAASADSPVQRLGRSIRFAISSLRQSLGFCARGIRILCRDLVEVALLLRTFTQGKPLKAADVQVGAAHGPWWSLMATDGHWWHLMAPDNPW
jgi:hypothetical protein